MMPVALLVGLYCPPFFWMMREDIMPVTNDTPPFRFIVMHNDKYYLTHELWEFDPKFPPEKLDPNQATFLKQIPTRFQGGTKTQGAVEIDSGHAVAFTEINRVKSTPGK
jgi:hypothetical protein